MKHDWVGVDHWNTDNRHVHIACAPTGCFAWKCRLLEAGLVVCLSYRTLVCDEFRCAG